MTTPPTAETLMLSAAAGSVVALLVTTMVVPFTAGLARRLGVIDEPGVRSSHTIATPRLGGLGVGAGALAGLAVAALVDPTILDRAGPSGVAFAVVLGGVALLYGVIGLADDLLRGIPVSVRLAAQIAVALMVVGPWVVAERTGSDPSGRGLVLVGAALAAAWVIGYVNAFNFMDGIDGISGFVAVVVGADLVLVGLLDDRAGLVVAGAVLAGAAVGFLRLNLRPATVFLGDGGSYFLGAWIAVAIVVGIELDTPPEALLAVTAPYLVDTAWTLVRRIARRADWRDSHHEHAYQQLVELGRSHRSVAAAVAGVSALCAALGLVSLTSAGPAARIGAGLAIVAVAVAYVAAPSLLRGARTEPPARTGSTAPEAAAPGRRQEEPAPSGSGRS